MAVTTAPWESLPTALLASCLRHGSKQDHSARFATCKAFAKAMLSSEPQPSLTVDVNAFHPALAIVLRWAEESHARYSLTLQGRAYAQPSSIQPFVQFMQQSNISFMGAHYVTCQALMLDSPGGLSAILPNLQELIFYHDGCQVAPGLLPLSGCTQLRRFELDRYHPAWPGADHSWLDQLQHLNTLPSLSSLEFNLLRHPTSFLPLLAGQLTQLCLATSAFMDTSDTPLQLTAATPSQLQAAMCHIAHLTSLRSLEFDHSLITAAHPATLSTLPQLQHLKLGFSAERGQEGCDNAYRALLQFPHLTSLECSHDCGFQLEESLAGEPCSWKHLRLGKVTPGHLAKLPLHSLTHLVYSGLTFSASQTVADVQAAADNLLRAQPPCIVNGYQRSFNLDFAEALEDELPGGATARSLVLAAKPLVPQDVTTILITHCNESHQLDAAVVSALAEVLPGGITAMYLMQECGIHASAWSQIARSFPQLNDLRVHTLIPYSAVAVMGYYSARLVEHMAEHQGPGIPKAADLKILYMPAQQDLDFDEAENLEAEKARWCRAFDDLNEQLGMLGLSARVHARAS